MRISFDLNDVQAQTLKGLMPIRNNLGAELTPGEIGHITMVNFIINSEKNRIEQLLRGSGDGESRSNPAEVPTDNPTV